MLKNYDQLVEINHNPNWPYIPDYCYRIWITGGSGSKTTNELLNLIKYQRPGIEKIYWYIKDPFESNLFINGREKVWIKTLKTPTKFSDYSKKIDDVYEKLEEYNPATKGKF